MGACGCGDANFDRGFRLPDGTTIGIEVYRGCRYCATGPGVTVAAFDAKGAHEWMDGVECPVMVPDEYGGDDRYALAVCLFDMADLLAECREIEAEVPIADYESVADWLEDNGLQLIQGAMVRQEKEQP